MRENRLEGKLRHLNWMQIKENLWDLVLNWLSNAALRKTGVWTNTFYKKIHNNFSWQYYDESYIPFVISLKGLLGKNIIPWFQNKPWPRVRTLLGKQPDMFLLLVVVSPRYTSDPSPSGTGRTLRTRRRSTITTVSDAASVVWPMSHWAWPLHTYCTPSQEDSRFCRPSNDRDGQGKEESSSWIGRSGDQIAVMIWYIIIS